MGQIKAGEEIQASDVLPPNSRPRRLEQEETPQERDTPRKRGTSWERESPKKLETPRKRETVVAFPPTPSPEELEEEESPRIHKRVVVFPPRSEPGRVEEIQTVLPGPSVVVLPQNTILTPPIGNPWTTGLFDCMLDPTNTLMTALLPCATFGQIAEVLDAGELTCPMGGLIYIMMVPAVLSCWLMGSRYRTKLRTRYGLVEAPHDDVFSHIFCPCCSLCQEFRELRNRGLDPALGWNGILAQRQQLEMMIANQQMNNPPPTQSMSM